MQLIALYHPFTVCHLNWEIEQKTENKINLANVILANI